MTKSATRTRSKARPARVKALNVKNAKQVKGGYLPIFDKGGSTGGGGVGGRK